MSNKQGGGKHAGKKLRRAGKGRQRRNFITYQNVQEKRAKHALAYPNDRTSLLGVKRWTHPPSIKPK